MDGMDQKKPMISVVVPVYNVKAYVEKCLNSILAQTYPNVEILVVDDGSTDGSGALCDTCKAKDDRIKVIHFPENRGLSAARNQGVLDARGEYICFVDSDDYVEPELLWKLYEGLTEQNADISICGAVGIKGKGEKAASYSQEEVVCCLARRSPFLWNAWGKLYPASLAKAHLFDERAFCCEDLLFFYQILKEAERISYLSDNLYHYVYRENSAVNSGIDEKKCKVLFSVLNHICKDASVNFPEAEMGMKQVAVDTAARLAMAAVELKMPGRQTWKYLKGFKTYIRQYFCLRSLTLCPDKKSKVAILTLNSSAAVFWVLAIFYKRIKGKVPRGN